MVNGKPRAPWKLYDKPVYWSVPNDGADFRCTDCQQRSPANEMILAQTPEGKRSMLHRECVCPDWLANAQNLGMFPE